jgi:hypothetical protein
MSGVAKGWHASGREWEWTEWTEWTEVDLVDSVEGAEAVRD